MSASTKKVCITAMGIALYVVLALCLQVLIFENYYLCLGYVVMMYFCYYCGPLSSMAVGGMGVVLYCLLTGGLRGMPGWALGNLVIGLVVGILCKRTANMKSKWFRQIIVVIAVIASTAIAMLGVKSLIECILYSQPFLFRVLMNIYAFIADAFVLIVSIPICLSVRAIVSGGNIQ